MENQNLILGLHDLIFLFQNITKRNAKIYVIHNKYMHIKQ